MPSKKKRRGFETLKPTRSNMDEIPPPVVTVGCKSDQKAVKIVPKEPTTLDENPLSINELPIPPEQKEVEEDLPGEQFVGVKPEEDAKERAAVLQRFQVLADLKDDQKIWIMWDGSFTPDTTGYGQWLVRMINRQKRTSILDQIGKDVLFAINHKQDLELQALCPKVVKGLEKTKNVYPKLSDRIDNFIQQLS